MRSHAAISPKSKQRFYWIVTALFCWQMGFTAYAQLRLPQVAEAFTHLGFPDYFRVQLSWAKLVGVVLLLAPVPARLKEWAYAGFAIALGSALVAHLAIGDGPEAWGWAAGTAVLWTLSYVLWRATQRANSGATQPANSGATLARWRFLVRGARQGNGRAARREATLGS